MPFREKIAWMSLVGTLVAFAFYFTMLIAAPAAAAELPGFSGGLLAPTIFILTLVMIVGGIAAAVSAPDEANAPADERDRRTGRRAASIAYAVLLPAVLIAAGTALFGFPVGLVLNLVLGAVVLAELVRNCAEIILYRRGS